MATFLIDYENPMGKVFFEIAEKHPFYECTRVTDGARELFSRRGKTPCTSFFDTVKNGIFVDVCNCNTIILFYSKCSVKKEELQKRIDQSTESYEYKLTKIKNGLDFQLGTYLGSILSMEHYLSDFQYYIVSGDKGFKAVIEFWQENSPYSDVSFKLLSSKTAIRKAIHEEVRKAHPSIGE
jgi:hypothetical protein